MLHDPTKEDLFYDGISKRAFIAWLETMHGNYDYTDPGGCAVGRFTGRSLSLYGTHHPDDEGHWLYKIVHMKPWTYEAALERALEGKP